MYKSQDILSEYSRIYDQFGDILFIHTPSGNFSYVNAAAERQLGYTQEELSQLSFADLLPEEFLAEAIDRTEKQRAGLPVKQPWNTKIISKDGKIEWYQLHTRSVYNSEGKLEKVFGVARNIQKQMVTEEKLHYYTKELERLVESRTKSVEASRRRFKELAELLPDSVFETDLEGNLTFVNEWAYRQFGYNKDDFNRGLNIFQMIVPEERDTVRKRTREILIGTSQGLAEYTALKKDGTTFPAIIHSSPMIREGKAAGIRGFIIDITERKEWERHLQNSERMEALGRLSGVVSHDFNNLLMGIMGHVTMALESLEENNPLRKHLRHIKEYVNTASGLTARLMGIARSGRLELQKIDINRQIEKEAELFGDRLSEVAVTLNLNPSLSQVWADPLQMEQVFLNLFLNARQAMFRENGEVIITTNLIHLDKKKSNQYNLDHGDYVLISVEDNGRGIEPEILDKIFEPFFTTKKGVRGSGLGLSSVYGIIKNHKGHITVKSEVGKGSIFKIYLPAVQSAENSTDPHHSDS
jgi:PAS domain S-box-containing protein